MSGLIEAIPPQLLSASKLAELLEFLRVAPYPKKYKKYLLIEWTHFVGIPLTREMVLQAEIEE